MKILSLKETAKMLTISRSTMYLLIKNKKISVIKITEKRVGVMESEIDKYLEGINRG